ncbi:MAG TPA: energy-coupling factor ABC transporter ATP-binding protein [Enteractinococcus helveticum]|uniref:Energy-coupling factor ABC transporter ATP-binding protein n=1 Tax=Enteractinococcus helveticum TaxID=1837282 RepID=A0A921FL69_9MICC|nr:ABC transporter ATP-binding protein [Enteractinococcus helveticum]HJF13501.1 energy-coupling factor ABC transporter ATP-binding protein [Enteractinococcus helveticum]
MITLENVTVTVKPDDAVLLDNVSATLDAPTTAIIGENGSGKSTLAKVLTGLLDYTGSAKIHDIEVATGRKQLSRRVGMIIANAAAQVIMPSVAEDIELSLRHLPKDQRQATLDAVLAEHDLTEFADRPALSLSSGQLQRLALASVLATRPDVLIADEPTTMLDARYAKLVGEQLFASSDRQLILITHDLQLAAKCQDIIWIHDAKIAHRGPDAICAYLEHIG